MERNYDGVHEFVHCTIWWLTSSCLWLARVLMREKYCREYRGDSLMHKSHTDERLTVDCRFHGLGMYSSMKHYFCDVAASFYIARASILKYILQM